MCNAKVISVWKPQYLDKREESIDGFEKIHMMREIRSKPLAAAKDAYLNIMGSIFSSSDLGELVKPEIIKEIAIEGGWDIRAVWV